MWVDHGAMRKLQIILQEDLWLKDRCKEEDVDANKWSLESRRRYLKRKYIHETATYINKNLYDKVI